MEVMYALTVVISGCGFGGSADMALQSRLGLLPERGVGTGLACTASVVLDGPHLIANRTAGITPGSVAERKNQYFVGIQAAGESDSLKNQRGARALGLNPDGDETPSAGILEPH
jgi:hypothetical protein